MLCMPLALSPGGHSSADWILVPQWEGKSLTSLQVAWWGPLARTMVWKLSPQ